MFSYIYSEGELVVKETVLLEQYKQIVQLDVMPRGMIIVTNEMILIGTGGEGKGECA